ncbi:ferrichrome ABC transporter substrate-binding protein [Paenibacillus anaericanus]|uniref:Ferrichrome ABC transporter substrate-binding protein n=1 Tax=Paenibacillus anaericanus TaxID=170367 RepID=A0A433YAZ6_9BACL|nr:helical backbone metal receptor [Paenibacillus anaericanus]RUT47039.1 ferrichrome ABC transporter substrate-binding protein [Paenibacillus anaericanus]
MKKTWGIVVLISIVIALAACGNKEAGNKNQEVNSSDQSNVVESNPSNNTEVTIDVDEAKVQELQAQFGQEKPAKAVTLSVAITELYDALQLDLVGVPTTQSQLPETYANVQRIGSSHSPDLEQIAKLEPNIVLAPESIKDSIDKVLQPAGLPAAYLPVDSLDELKESLVALGRIYGKEDQAKEVLTSFSEKEAEALKVVEGKSAPSVMLLFGSAESLMLMNEDTFAGSLAKKLGASNVLSSVLKQSETYVPLNMETIVEANPDVILLVAHGDPTAVAQKFEEDVKKNGVWEKLNAFKNERMVTLDYNLYGVASLAKAPDAYKDLAAILYKD